MVRRSLSALTVAILLAACSSETPTTDETAEPPETSTDASTDDPDTPIAGSVVALDPYVTQPTAALLDTNVVGRAVPAFDAPIMTFLDDGEQAVLDAATDVGWQEYDLEVMLGLTPDVIVTTEMFVAGEDDIVDRLEQVAEVRQIGGEYHDDWRAAVLGAAEALGDDEGVVEQRVGELDDRISSLRETVEATGYTASLLNVRAQDDVRLYVASCGTSILDDIGFARPEDHPEAGDDINVELSLERLPEADADVLFTFLGSTGTDPATLEAEVLGIEDNPLYQSLGAVEAGRAYLVDADWWFGCGSLQAAEAMVTDIEEVVAGW